MYTYRLVYILATKNGCGWRQLDDGSSDSEFQNRAAAREYVNHNKANWNEDVYILRKEVSHFYDQKIFDIKNK